LWLPRCSENTVWAFVTLFTIQAERRNGKIQEIKIIEKGYRGFENFTIEITFFCGGLSLHPQKLGRTNDFIQVV